MKPAKIFECSCADGFTGDFCEFKTEQDHLLFIYRETPLVFNADGRLIEENAVIDEQSGAFFSCSTMLNGEAIIFGGWISNNERQVHLKLIFISFKYHPLQISLVSECTLKRLGDLPFDFRFGTCGTFMINRSPTILLCFDYNERRKCRSLTRRKNGALSDINDFAFDSEFQIDEIVITDSTHDHYRATIANYQGFPLILGGTNEQFIGNNKLEMLNIMENPPRWVEYEGTDYPYSNT